MAELEEILSVIENGVIGPMPYPRLSEFMRGYGSTELRELAEALLELGVVAARWEQQESTSPENGVWKAYLVLTLAEFNTPQSLSWRGRPLSVGPGSLEHLHLIAVAECGCYYYALKGQELRLEYQVASEQAVSDMQSVLNAGTIGEMPFALFLSYGGGIYLTPGAVAYRLGIFGVARVRWEVGEFELNDRTHWHAFLVATLTPSSFTSPPSLPSHWLIFSIAEYLMHAPDYFTTKVSGKELELWVLYRVKLPVDAEELDLLEASGINIPQE